MIVFACTACKQQLNVPDGNVGQLITCSHCHQKVIVPGSLQPIIASIVPDASSFSLGKIPLWLWLVGVPLGMIFMCCGGCGMLAMIGGRTDRSAAFSSSVSSAPAPPTVISDLQWREVDNVYNLKSRTTELQKSELWKNYKGKRVRWTGTVAHIAQSFGTVRLQIKMNEDTFASDLIISLKGDQKQQALRLQKGDAVTFVGTLENWGTLLPISLSEGEIID